MLIRFLLTFCVVFGPGCNKPAPDRNESGEKKANMYDENEPEKSETPETSGQYNSVMSQKDRNESGSKKSEAHQVDLTNIQSLQIVRASDFNIENYPELEKVGLNLTGYGNFGTADPDTQKRNKDMQSQIDQTKLVLNSENFKSRLTINKDNPGFISLISKIENGEDIADIWLKKELGITPDHSGYWLIGSTVNSEAIRLSQEQAIFYFISPTGKVSLKYLNN